MMTNFNIGNFKIKKTISNWSLNFRWIINSMVILFLIFIASSCHVAKTDLTKNNTDKMTTSFENNNNSTPTYFEVIDYYKALAERHGMINMNAFGNTDSGEPLHEIIVSKDGLSDPKEIRDRGDMILFINNAIHPGEPCGIDASMMWIRDLMNKPQMLDGITVVMIPFYNIGGGLNRNSHSRTNQEGPEAYGFRGNARNLDLNRDFVKCDSENAKSFNQLFNKWNPEVMIDNHTSNGADYQYVMTLIATQKDKLHSAVSEVMTNDMIPFLYDKMETKNWEMVPYVYARETPDEGIAGFLDYGRYSSGYAALHHTISFMPETHMLKPYEDRVWSTYAFMQCMLEYLTVNGNKVKEAKLAAMASYAKAGKVALDWAMDMEKIDSLEFKGYAAKYKPSEVSGLSRLYYDRNEPKTMTIPFYNSYKNALEVDVPKAYIFPQAYKEVVERLEWNGVKVERLESDQAISVEAYFIEDYKDHEAYEGHYLHHSIKVRKESAQIGFRKGDYKVSTDQTSARYIIETLEPQAPDSYFAWNFFDGILMQKEYFSPYVFEDLAAEILKENPDLKLKLEAKRSEDEAFKNDANAQLEFVYKNSPHYEDTHKRYPVFRVK